MCFLRTNHMWTLLTDMHLPVVGGWWGQPKGLPDLAALHDGDAALLPAPTVLISGAEANPLRRWYVRVVMAHPTYQLMTMVMLAMPVICLAARQPPQCQLLTVFSSCLSGSSPAPVDPEQRLEVLLQSCVDVTVIMQTMPGAIRKACARSS